MRQPSHRSTHHLDARLVWFWESRWDQKIAASANRWMLSLFYSRLPSRHLYLHYSKARSSVLLANKGHSHYKTLYSKHMATVAQPEWKLPASNVAEPVLKVYNSLTRTKVCNVSAFRLITHWAYVVFICYVDRICGSQRTACEVVQLRTYCLWCIAYGSC